MYIDLAHPHKGGLEPEQRRIKMNNILRVISNYQGSDYTHIQPISNTLNYLNSVRYIEELQNIFEDDQYKYDRKNAQNITTLTHLYIFSENHSNWNRRWLRPKRTANIPPPNQTLHPPPSTATRSIPVHWHRWISPRVTSQVRCAFPAPQRRAHRPPKWSATESAGVWEPSE